VKHESEKALGMVHFTARKSEVELAGVLALSGH
jgi:hypothetical protein